MTTAEQLRAVRDAVAQALAQRDQSEVFGEHIVEADFLLMPLAGLAASPTARSAEEPIGYVCTQSLKACALLTQRFDNAAPRKGQRLYMDLKVWNRPAEGLSPIARHRT